MGHGVMVPRDQVVEPHPGHKRIGGVETTTNTPARASMQFDELNLSVDSPGLEFIQESGDVGYPVHGQTHEVYGGHFPSRPSPADAQR